MKDNIYSSKRVQNPLAKKKPTIPKFQNQCKVYSIKNINIQEDKKFQTQQEIQTEKQNPSCFQNSPAHKNKNKQRTWKRSTIDLLATKQQIKQKKANLKLSVYYCDSIAIRPMSENEKLQDLLKQPEKEITVGNLTQQNILYPLKQKQVYKFTESNEEANNKIQFKEIQQIICSKAKSKFKSRKKIFSQKCQNKGLKLSKALRTEMQIQNLKKILGVDEFHITFEAQKITQCCT